MIRSKPNKHYRNARRALLGLALLVAAIIGWQWLQSHPEHNPYAPLDLRHQAGWATAAKLGALRSDVAECRAVLARSDVAFTALPATGDGDCARPDRTLLGEYPLAPDTPTVSCPVAAALELWRSNSVVPAAQAILGSELARIEHLGAYSCRRIYGGADGRWSEHATGNAIDIAAFVLEDGRRISVLSDWDGTPEEAAFLRAVRDGACAAFSTVLSPDYNAAHADHFHFDQDARRTGVCR